MISADKKPKKADKYTSKKGIDTISLIVLVFFVASPETVAKTKHNIFIQASNLSIGNIASVFYYQVNTYFYDYSIILIRPQSTQI